jgi:amino acid adenylation domain-containing protein
MFTKEISGSIVLAFEEVVSRFPHLCALRWLDESWTYAEINTRANRLAHYLIASGVRQEEIVGVLSQRSPQTLIAFLAILKAGGAYLSLDPAYPEDRLKYYVENASVKTVLTDVTHPDVLGSTSATLVTDYERRASDCPATNPKCLTTPGSAAQVFFTSGSTGHPKGVVIEHRGVLRLAQFVDYVEIGPKENVLQITPLNYDVSTFEIWATWLNGACLVLPAPGLTSINDLASAFRTFQITLVLLPSSLIPLLLEQELESFQTVRQLVVGGDVLPPICAEKFLGRYPDSRLVNAYGPTENTVITSTYRVELEKPMPSRLSIGRPIQKTEVLILDEDLQPVSPGKTGEIVITGDGLARGYLNQPELTARSFVQITDASGASVRAYRSGDLGRYLPDGNLMFEGRIDEQVKINGVRIELGEIKSVLLSNPQVAEAEVLVSEKAGIKRLEAFVVLKTASALDVPALREFLAKKVPLNWLPTTMRILLSMPRGPGGKVDRRVLMSEISAPPTSADDVEAEPQDALERVIWKIWKEVVPGIPFGRHDRFADLGADSLSALKVVAKVEALIGRRIGLNSLLIGGTIVDMANAARRVGPAVRPPLMIRVQSGETNKQPFFFAHGDYTCGGLYCQRLARIVGPERSFYAISPQGTFGEALPPTFEEAGASVLEQVRSVQPKGPYYLGGYCNGALAMYEVAQQLINSGETVIALVLLDPPDLYFVELRQKVMALGRRFGLKDSDSRSISHKIAEWIELYNAFGPMHFVSELFKKVRVKIPQYAARCVGTTDLEQSWNANLDLHYYVVIADYEPKLYRGLAGVHVILREGEDLYRPRQIKYWNNVIPNARFKIVSGTHLEFQSSLPEIGSFIQTVLKEPSAKSSSVPSGAPVSGVA